MRTELITWILFFANAFQTYYFFSVFLERRFRHFYLEGCIYAIMILLGRYITNSFSLVGYAIVAVVVLVLQIISLYVFFKIEKWYKPWIAQGILMTIMMVLQFPAMSLAELITGSHVFLDANLYNFDLSYVITTALNCMVFMIVFLIVYAVLFIRRYGTGREIVGATVGLVIYQTIVVVFFFMLCWENGENAVNGGALFVIFSIGLDIVVQQSIERLYEKQLVEQEWRLLQELRVREYENYLCVQNKMDKLRLQRHDCVNYLQVLERLIETGEGKKEVCKVIDEMRRKYCDTGR